MSSIVRVKIGEVLPLQLQAYDGKTTLHPQVILKDEAGANIAGSPFNLTHVGLGLYTNRLLNMTFNTIIVAIFKVYVDAGHTTLDPNYQDEIDVFLQENIITVPAGVIDGTMFGSVDPGGNIVGHIVDAPIYLSGEACPDQLVGYAFDDSPILGTIDNDTLTGVANLN